MTVKRAHMVTRAYLESWADKRGRVHVWDSENLVEGVRSIRDATVVSYAYQTEVATLDLEEEYASVESKGVPALRSFASGGEPNRDGRAAVVRFLDMHLERGRFADQAKTRVPIASINIYSGTSQMREMGLGDRLTFARDIDKRAVRLSTMNLERWNWRILTGSPVLVTGDGAVLLFQRRASSAVSTVAFPLSPEKLLVIGEDLDRDIVANANFLVAGKCRRWLVDRPDGEVARAIRFR